MASKGKKAEVPAEAVAAMRAHREGEHGEPFDLDRHVSYDGHSRSRAPMTYSPPSPGRAARYHCQECPARVFVLGEPDYSDPDAQELWLLQNPQAVAGLRRIPAEDRGAAIAA